MKIQCNCGAKYSFDVTPEMGRSPIRFVCQACGLDSSEMVNQLIRQQLGLPAAAPHSVSGVAPPVAIAPRPAHVRSPVAATPAVASSASVPPPAPPRVAPVVAIRAGETMAPPAGTAPALRVSGHSSPGQAAAAAAPQVGAPQTCAKHAGQLASQQCRVCGKPMCPKCMESFGYVCSAYCKGKAENQGIHLPAYAGQRQYAESRQSRKLTLIVGAVLGGVALFLGAWGWYAWVGSVPKVAFSLRLPEPGYSGQLRILPGDQAVFLHGGTLVRHDMKGGKEVWSNVLIDKKQINDRARAEHERQKAEREKIYKEGGNLSEGKVDSFEEILDSMLQEAAAALRLHVRGGNVWVSFPDRVTQFDWATGQPAKELPIGHPIKRMVCSGDDLLLASEGSVTRVNLVSGGLQTEQAVAGGLAGTSPTTPKGARGSTNQTARAGGGVATSSGRPSGTQPSGTRSQYLSTPAKLAAPAVVASSANQQRLKAAMNDDPAANRTGVAGSGSGGSDNDPLRIVADRDGAFQLSAVPFKAGQFQVSVRSLGQGKGEWSGEMPGWPELFPLKTVDVVLGGKSMVALDKSGKKRWEATLTRGLGSYSRPLFTGEADPTGEGPVVEHADTLYFYDSSELVAFDLGSGSTRWRFDSVGTSGLFFDDRGMIYVNTTTVSPGSKSGGGEAHPMVFKLDSKTGKPLWQREREGLVGYVSGKFVYTVESYAGDKDDVDGLPGVETVFHVPAFVRIRRLDPDNGRILWQHHQPRFPLDVQFDRNSFQVLFKKEVQVLKFVSL